MTKPKKNLNRTKNIIWMIAGSLMIMLLILAIRLVINVGNYFP